MMKAGCLVAVLAVGLISGCGSSSSTTAPISTVTEVDTTTNTDLYDIVDTNQLVCFNSFSGAAETCTNTGYDADYSGNQPSYTVSSDGLTVLDNVTGLTWTQSTDIDGSGLVDYDDKRFQSEAVTYCTALNLGGYVDWRLPDLKEAYSLRGVSTSLAYCYDVAWRFSAPIQLQV